MRKALFSLLIAAALSACGGGDDKGKKAGQEPLVRAEIVGTATFVDRIQAVGTAQANEQVIVSAPVTERITRIHFVDGAYVKRGQVLATLAAGQETSTLQGDTAELREAEIRLDRLLKLKAQGFATNADVDAQTATVQSLRAQAGATRATIVDRVVTAPFSGVLSLRKISTGAVVSAGTEIATISDISSIKLDFTVPETDIAKLKPGLPISAIAAAYPKEPFNGSIATVDTVVDPTTRAVTVRAILPNRDGRLKPGMLLTVVIESAARTAVAAPELAVVAQGDQSFIYVVDAKGEAVRTPVKVGKKQDGKVEILGGIAPGQKIVTEGVVKLTGPKVKVKLAGPIAAANQAKQEGQKPVEAPASTPAAAPANTSAPKEPAKAQGQ